MGISDEDDGPEPGRAVIEDLARAAFPDGAPVPRPRVQPPPPPVVDLSVEPAGSRTVVDFIVVAIVVVTVLAAAVAYGDPDPVTIGLTLVLVAVLIVTWWLRNRHRHRTVTVTSIGSRLEIRDGGLHVFDLARTDSPLDVIGLPGDRNWRVLIHRRSMRPYVVDASMVDPAEFMRVLHAHRPEVHYRPQ